MIKVNEQLLLTALVRHLPLEVVMSFILIVLLVLVLLAVVMVISTMESRELQKEKEHARAPLDSNLFH